VTLDSGIVSENTDEGSGATLTDNFSGANMIFNTPKSR